MKKGLLTPPLSQTEIHRNFAALQQAVADGSAQFHLIQGNDTSGINPALLNNLNVSGQGNGRTRALGFNAG